MGGRGKWISEFKTSLVYRVSSKTAKAIQRNPVSKIHTHTHTHTHTQTVPNSKALIYASNRISDH